ncbi:MAG: hydantoinase/oxoprolinase family protein [Geminicoccaceae bacterium]
MASEQGRDMEAFRVGVDIGGTFTDIVLLGDDGRVHTRKVASSADDYARAIAEALAEVFAELGIGGDRVAEVRHGTTVASNAILEHKGARTGLITTRGFRDVLEIRNLRMPRLYDITWTKPPPLVERHLRVVVDERMDHQGQVVRPLDPADAERAVQSLLAQGVEAIAVCLLHAYANPAHERLIAATTLRLAPGLPTSISSEVLPEIKEYERTSSTVINAYITPIVARYLERLGRNLAGQGVRGPLLIMQSNGGLMTAAAAAARPMHVVESGPAGGVVGAQALARAIGAENVVTFDMGGTTAKAGIIERGAVSRTLEYQVGGGIMTGSRLLTGAGYLLKVPAIDLAEVGAGGGSIVRIDAGGSMTVGPESAGAAPGPVCYASGGVEPTITDANVILGYLNPGYLIGGALRLDADLARRVFADQVARPLGLSLEHAAYGAHRIAAANMIRAIRAVSIERGRDPRAFALCAFGGNGPVFACAMAKELGMRTIVVPPAPGLFSAFGLLYADVEHHYGRSLRRLLRQMDLGALNQAWDDLAFQARAQLQAEGFARARMRIQRQASLHYQGQSFDLTVPVPDGVLDPAALARLEEAFGQEHERTYGHRAGPEEPVELTEIRLIGHGIAERPLTPQALDLEAADRDDPLPPRRAYFGTETGWLDTPVITRAALATPHEGPCIVEEYDATCVVPPGARASLDPLGNILIGL